MRPESARDGSRGLPRRVRGTCHPVGVLRRASGPLPGRPGDPRGAGIKYSRGPGSPKAPGPMPHLYEHFAYLKVKSSSVKQDASSLR